MILEGFFRDAGGFCGLLRDVHGFLGCSGGFLGILEGFFGDFELF